MGHNNSDSDNVNNLISTAKGGQIIAGNFQIDFYPNAFDSDTNVSSNKAKESLAAITEQMKNEGIGSDELANIGDAYDVDIGSAKLSVPALIKTKYDPNLIPADFSLDDLKFIQYRDGERVVLPTYINTSKQIIYTETDHFSPIGIVALLCIMVAEIAPPLFLTHAILVYKDYTNVDLLEPEKVEDVKFRIEQNKDSTELKLQLENKTLKGIEGLASYKKVTKPSKLLKSDKISGICTDFSFLFGSLLISKGYNVRIVTGTIYVKEKNGDGYQPGNHLWAEVVVNNKPYYIDTYNPSNITLVPLHEAYLKYRIKKVGHSIWKELKGKKYVSGKSYRHNCNWWKSYVTEEIEETDTQMYERIAKAKKVLEIRQKEFLSSCNRLDNLRESIENAVSKKKIYKRIYELEKHIEKRRKQLQFGSRNLDDMEKEINSPWKLRSEANENIEPIFSYNKLSVQNSIQLHDGLWNYELKHAGNDTESIKIIDSVFSFSRTLFFEDVRFWKIPKQNS